MVLEMTLCSADNFEITHKTCSVSVRDGAHFEIAYTTKHAQFEFDMQRLHKAGCNDDEFNETSIHIIY